MVISAIYEICTRKQWGRSRRRFEQLAQAILQTFSSGNVARPRLCVAAVADDRFLYLGLGHRQFVRRETRRFGAGFGDGLVASLRRSQQRRYPGRDRSEPR